MGHALKELLGNDALSIESVFRELEKSTGNSGLDTELIGEMRAKTHAIVKVLGIDPLDSTAREVYHALNAYITNGGSEAVFHDADYVVAKYGVDIISFNLIDIVDNIHHQLTFDKRRLAHGQHALRAEIIDRYTKHPRTHDEAVKRAALHGELIKEGDEHRIRLKKHLQAHPVVHKKPLQKIKLVKPIDAVKKPAAPRNSIPIQVTQSKPAIAATKKVVEKEIAMKPYILAIGDIFTDAFIKLNEDVARVETDENGEKRISLPLGSKPPYDDVEIVQGVGPAPNAAVAVARLGLTAGLDAFLGSDQVGTDAIAYLQSENVDTTTMHVEEGMKTSYYYVLRYGAERTILVKNEAFKYVWKDPAEEPAWVYLALISDDSWEYHQGLLAYLEAHPKVKLAFQPGTFHFKWGVEKLAALYRRSHIIVLNREEAVDITGKSYDSVRDLAYALHDLGPEKVVITDGPNGSYASYDFKLVTIPNYPDPGPPVDRTGAGDAFASTIVSALALGESMDTALTWAPINSMNVVQHLGAQAGLLTREKLEQLLADAPDDYKLTDFEG